MTDGYSKSDSNLHRLWLQMMSLAQDYSSFMWYFLFSFVSSSTTILCQLSHSEIIFEHLCLSVFN